jgi:hypothetical protein
MLWGRQAHALIVAACHGAQMTRRSLIVCVTLAVGAVHFFATMASAQPALAPYREMVVDVDRAEVRELPHAEAPVFAKLSKGSVVFELRRVGTWIEIRGLSEKIGWIESAKLALRENERAPSATGALTAAAIAAVIAQASRRAYYATGRPCACPDDVTSSGRRCGRNSAYSRPGGAQPLCYPSDVPIERIEEYRERLRTGAVQ